MSERKETVEEQRRRLFYDSLGIPLRGQSVPAVVAMPAYEMQQPELSATINTGLTAKRRPRKKKPGVDQWHESDVRLLKYMDRSRRGTRAENNRRNAANEPAEEARRLRFVANGIVGMELGEVLEDGDPRVPAMAEQIHETNDFLRQRHASFNTLTFPGQRIPAALPQLDVDVDTPATAWFTGLTQQLTTYAGLMQQGIMSFDLMRSIQATIDPTPEQVVSIRRRAAERRIEAEFNSLSKEDQIIRSIEIMSDRVYGSSATRLAESRTFSRIVDNFHTSVEAIGRMQTTGPSFGPSIYKGKKPRHMKHGRDTQKQGHSQVPQVSNRMARDRPFRPQTMPQSVWLRRLLASFDCALSRFGVTAVFAEWSPYGLGPENMRTVWVIYDNVVEATNLIASINEENLEPIHMLDVITGLVTADATTTARVVSHPRAVTTTTASCGLYTGSTSRSVALNDVAEGSTGRWLNIPVQTAFEEYLAARWIQSHLQHELQIPTRYIQDHMVAVELRLGLHRGECYHHPPTMFELSGMSRVCSSISAGVGSVRNFVRNERVAYANEIGATATVEQLTRIPSRYGPGNDFSEKHIEPVRTSVSAMTTDSLCLLPVANWRQAAEELTSSVTTGASLIATGASTASRGSAETASSIIQIVRADAQLVGGGVAGTSSMILNSVNGLSVTITPVASGIDMVGAIIVPQPGTAGDVVAEVHTQGQGIFKPTLIKPLRKIRKCKRNGKGSCKRRR